jgi:hypothetical protein
MSPAGGAPGEGDGGGGGGERDGGAAAGGGGVRHMRTRSEGDSSTLLPPAWSPAPAAPQRPPPDLQHTVAMAI